MSGRTTGHSPSETLLPVAFSLTRHSLAPVTVVFPPVAGGDRPLLILEVRRLPVLDDFVVAHRKLVSRVQTHAQQRLVVEPAEEMIPPRGAPLFFRNLR